MACGSPLTQGENVKLIEQRLSQTLLLSDDFAKDEECDDTSSSNVQHLEPWEVNEALSTLLRLGLQEQHWYQTQVSTRDTYTLERYTPRLSIVLVRVLHKSLFVSANTEIVHISTLGETYE